MFRIALAVSLSVLVAGNALAAFTKDQELRPATPAELALKDVPYAPGAAAVILDWVEFDDDPLSAASEYYRIKILTEEGRKYADVEVPYLAGYDVGGRVTDIDARTIQPDGRIVPFDGKVYDKVLFKGGGLRVRAKTFSLPDVQPGSILEYRYQRRWANRLLMNTHWVIQRDIPVLRARMTLKPYDTQGQFQSFFTYYNLPEGKAPVYARNQYDLELTNVPVYPREEFAPPEESTKIRVTFYYTEGHVEPAKFWNAQGNRWNKSVDGFIGKANTLRPAAQPLLGKDPMETLRNIYAKVQTFRNLNYQDETSAAGGKKNAAEVIARGEGYSSEINQAFVALARAAGLDASVVRVGPRDRYFFSENILDGEQMNGEIAAVTIGSETRYYDPGTPTAPFGIVSWEKTAVPGMRIAKGPAQIATVAEMKSEDAILRRKADLRLNGDLLEGTVTATYLGQEALVRRLRTWGDDEATRAKDLEDEARGWFPDGATVKLTEVTGATSHAEPVVAKFTVTLPNLVAEAGSRTVLPISIFAANAKNPFASATRAHPIYFRYLRREEDEVKVTLPETLTLAGVPAPAKLNAGALEYTNEVKQEGNAVVFKRNASVHTIFVEAQHYRPLRNFFSNMVAADQKPLVLVSK